MIAPIKKTVILFGAGLSTFACSDGGVAKSDLGSSAIIDVLVTQEHSGCVSGMGEFRGTGNYVVSYSWLDEEPDLFRPAFPQRLTGMVKIEVDGDQVYQAPFEPPTASLANGRSYFALSPHKNIAAKPYKLTFCFSALGIDRPGELSLGLYRSKRRD